MITDAEIEALIKNVIPDARIEVTDMTGTRDHFDIRVESKFFAGKSLIEQHKMIFSGLESEMDKRIHAVKLKTKVLEA